MRWSRKCIAKRDGPPQLFISFLSFFRATLPVYTDLWIWYGYNTQYILRIFITQYFKLYYTQVFRFFKDNEINVIIPNFCPPVYYAWGYHNRTPCQMSCLLVFVHHKNMKIVSSPSTNCYTDFYSHLFHVHLDRLRGARELPS